MPVVARCSGHGYWQDGACACTVLWSGPDCSVPFSALIGVTYWDAYLWTTTLAFGVLALVMLSRQVYGLQTRSRPQQGGVSCTAKGGRNISFIANMLACILRVVGGVLHILYVVASAWHCSRRLTCNETVLMKLC